MLAGGAFAGAGKDNKGCARAHLDDVLTEVKGYPMSSSPVDAPGAARMADDMTASRRGRTRMPVSRAPFPTTLRPTLFQQRL